MILADRNYQRLNEEFERFSIDFFEAYGLLVQQNGRPNEHYDLLLLSDSVVFPVELKLYRSVRVSASIIQKVCERLSVYKLERPHRIPVLFTTAFLNARARKDLERRYNVKVIGLAEINSSLFLYPLLKARLQSLLGEAQVFGDSMDEIPPSEDISSILNLPIVEILAAEADTTSELPSSGAQQAVVLESIPCGRENAAEYERQCILALKLLFATDLRGWEAQSRTNTGLHRFDLIVRVKSEDDFWNALVSDFRSRYVVFEFKNYCDLIGQEQVYTTEKYLYPAAMRGTAIIISKMGPDDNALEASRGALRESGKVILHLTTAEICKMLRGLDQGDSASDRLAHLLFETLRSLDR